jgi:hypothetical protein
LYNQDGGQVAKGRSMKNWIRSGVLLASGAVLWSQPGTALAQSNRKLYLERDKGKAFQDSHYKTAPQRIPGRVECAAYDVGGEGVAYHDSDPVNHGSGQLNPADGTYLNEFRMHDGVDTSYTKFPTAAGKDAIDNNAYETVTPPKDLLYVGWTEPGQWHHWNILRNAVTLDLPAGRNVLTVHIVTGGNMNLAYFDFRPAAEK